ncbi:hypothetical protein [Synechococcus sp. UW69]|uniref:hypothetical protein n=1 Tax=Synechococcus sp. UW69 TaxID=368493 RepID=UPI000E0E684E|nr:hypothetical protein [Synechococcus sp. UW69]
MKFTPHAYKQHSPQKIPKQEQGLSMLIALMMGLVLMAGVTGLLLRQLMGRKLGASESYQQMAETAALNGFNRILSELNNNDNTAYKGYLLTLNHHQGDTEIPGSEEWGWNPANQTNFPLREPCTDRSRLPDAAPANSETSNRPYVELTERTTSQREDGKGNIQLQYRLRGYTTTATATNNGTGEGRFQIEGLVVRAGDAAGTGYLARTLLLRSLYVNSIVAGEGDWAVLAGQTLSLGDTKILQNSGQTGEGKVLLNVSTTNQYSTSTGCSSSNLLDDVNASLTNNNLEGKIVPIMGQGLPTSILWNQGFTQDKVVGSSEVRVWSFDDSGGLDECGGIACSRDVNSATASNRNDLEEDAGSVIRLSFDELCEGTGADCHIYVEHINLTKSRLLIETSADRPVVLHLEYPNTSTTAPSQSGITGSINLESGSQICGVNVGSSTCNGKPEQLVILSSTPKPTSIRSCAATPQNERYVLDFDGNSLPHATVHLIPGIVKTGSSTTQLNGLIWADVICTDAGPFSLITDTSGGRSVVRDLNEQWNWESQNFPGYGQMVTRGVRGTGLDTFRRW